MKAIATACANIALVKYWGKRDESLNLPARGSLSMAIEALRTSTAVELIEGSSDELFLEGLATTGAPLLRVSRFLDLVRREARSNARARVVSVSTFPLAAGLASSASGFAALAVASARAFGLGIGPSALSIFARRGSGSAARSIFGGFVRMDAGEKDDGTDSFSRPLEGVNIELSAAIAIARSHEDAAGSHQKKIGSTEGMEHTRKTSPYHDSWLRTVECDLPLAEEALRRGDLARLGEIAEANCLAMHADAMAARPGIIYFRPPTLWAIECVRSLRRKGTPVFFSIDAGPHLVAFTPPDSLERVRNALAEHAGIARVMTSGIGGPATLIDALPEERNA